MSLVIVDQAWKLHYEITWKYGKHHRRYHVAGLKPLLFTLCWN